MAPFSVGQQQLTINSCIVAVGLAAYQDCRNLLLATVFAVTA
ncbi:hypothetical protein QNH14_18740 [Apirhabdus apintestini]|nr:hypothetical protein QNH14_18740 [Enterobacteriaceae bacterium CA-0114]